MIKTNKNSKNSSTNDVGILLLSHGSRLPDSRDVINSLKEKYQEEFPEHIVEIGFMEIAKPNIPEAFENLKKRGNLNKIIVVPVFVAHGLHTKRDIPNILGLETEKIKIEHNHHHHHHHEVEKVDFDGEIVFTDPLGDDLLVLEIIKKRISNAL